MLSLRSRGRLKNKLVVPDGFRQHQARLKEQLEALLPGTSHPLHDVAAHHFSDPGKLLRGTTAMACAEAMHVDETAALQWALSVELMHNASLVHDDLCDGDETRRNQMTVWKLFGNQQAICFGDWLVAKSFDLAARAAQSSGMTSFSLVTGLAAHMGVLSSGQALEFVATTYPDWEDYKKVVHGKTTPLIVAPVEGAIQMSGGNANDQGISEALSRLGLAYQISDDIRNILGTDGAQHAVGDLKRRAPNAVIVLFREVLKNGSLTAFENWLASGHVHNLDLWLREIKASTALNSAAAEIEACLAHVDEALNDMSPELVSVLSPLMFFLADSCMQATEQVAEAQRNIRAVS
ncbi:MAG: polyprenyl synthetase family protein [Parvibaculales bacterium]